MVSSFATGPYAAFLPGNHYLCRLNFRGWTFEALTNALQAGLASVNGNSLWEERGGAYRAGEIAFQGSYMLRTGLSRIGKPFGIRGGSERIATTAIEASASHDVPAAASGQEYTWEIPSGMRADHRSMTVHDMKSSLVLIGGFIQRLISCPDIDPECQRRYLEIIQKEGCKLESLLDDFLADSELDGELQLENKPICLDRELQEICEAHQLRAARREMVLKLEKPPRLSLVLADMRRLQRVFGNLLDNALKFSPPGSTIQVMLQETEQEISISFADEGPGIDARDLPFLFSAHYRGRNGDKAEGTGLGLATVKYIVEAHGGKVLADNRANRGAVFTVILPRGGRPGAANARAAGRPSHLESPAAIQQQ
jgi:signal transduction histidine kinase